MIKPYVVGIMGAGRIAQGFDKPGDSHVLTIAHAVTSSSAFRLGGFYDLDSEKSEAAERKWGSPQSPRDRVRWLNQPWDVVCIATPDEQHVADIRDVLPRKPKALMVEKPLAIERDDAINLLREANRLGVPVLVDFPRRWHSGVAAVSEQIVQGSLGKPLAATFVYSGEAIHSAVHLLDLFHMWWGGGWNVELESCRSNIVHVTFARMSEVVAASFVKVPAISYYVLEMHIYCERGKIELSRSPEMLEVSELGPHPLYPSFQVLTPLKSFHMEAEPLLVRLMEKLAGMIEDPVMARTQAMREMDSQVFSSQVLRCIQNAIPFTDMMAGGINTCPS
jgi:predicted dehydrogenase